MGRFTSKACSAILAVILLPVPASSAIQKPQKAKKKAKSSPQDVMNFDGGIFFETDGGVSDITCFRLNGRVTSEHFFDNFKRVDDVHGTQYRRGQDSLTEFPEELRVSLIIFDFPCASQLDHPGPRRYLTQDMMRTLRFSFYWKRGLELRHIESIKQDGARAEPVELYNAGNKEELAKRYRWYIDFTVPSVGIPLTDRLVVVVRMPDGRTAARVAARL